jgi:hypothetical protein
MQRQGAHVKDARLPEDRRAQTEALVVRARVVKQRPEVAARPVEQREEQNGQAREDDVVDGRGDAVDERLAGEAVVDLKVEEHAREDGVLVERVLDEAAEAVARDLAVHEQQAHQKAELADRIVAVVDRLPALLACDADADVGRLDHRDIVRAVADREHLALQRGTDMSVKTHIYNMIPGKLCLHSRPMLQIELLRGHVTASVRYHACAMRCVDALGQTLDARCERRRTPRLRRSFANQRPTPVLQVACARCSSYSRIIVTMFAFWLGLERHTTTAMHLLPSAASFASDALTPSTCVSVLPSTTSCVDSPAASCVSASWSSCRGARVLVSGHSAACATDAAASILTPAHICQQRVLHAQQRCAMQHEG